MGERMASAVAREPDARAQRFTAEPLDKSPNVIQGTEDFGVYSASALAVAGASVADAADMEKFTVCAVAA